MAESPTAAFILSLLGGIFVLIGGFVVIVIGSLLESLGGLGGSTLPGGLGNLTSITGGFSGIGFPIASLGVLGVLLGSGMIVLAILIHLSPGRHQLWGALVLVFSLVSWVGALGGLLVGFLLGLIGGVLAISWRPSTIMQASSAQITRICPNCGTVIQKDTKFCPQCGRSMPYT